MEITGGDWLRKRDNYDREMCIANGWECKQERHYDVIIEGEKYEVKKTKTGSVIIKLQQLAEIRLNKDLSDINYLIIRTDKDQENIIEAYVISGYDLCEFQNMSEALAKNILSIHENLKCTIQNSISLKKLRQNEKCLYKYYDKKLLIK